MCKVAKDDRGDISLPMFHYHSENQARTLDELKTIASTQPKQSYGVLNFPILDIEPTHFIPGEFHLMMRISDVLIRNLIMDDKNKDDFATIVGGATDNVTLLVTTIQSCGVNFKA